MGGEFGQAREWSEERSLDWHLLGDPLHGGIKSLVGDLNRAYRDSPALCTRDDTPEGFSWIDANDAAGNVLSFLRHGVDADGNPTVLACVANFSGSPQPRLPGRPALRRALARGAQHRRRELRRLRRGQPGGRRGRAADVARAARVGRAAPAAVRGAVAGPRSGSRPGRRRTSGRPLRWRRSPRRSWATRPRRLTRPPDSPLTGATLPRGRRRRSATPSTSALTDAVAVTPTCSTRRPRPGRCGRARGRARRAGGRGRAAGPQPFRGSRSGAARTRPPRTSRRRWS